MHRSIQLYQIDIHRQKTKKLNCKILKYKPIKTMMYLSFNGEIKVGWIIYNLLKFEYKSMIINKYLNNTWNTDNEENKIIKKNNTQYKMIHHN